jgi:hypothetical protein
VCSSEWRGSSSEGVAEFAINRLVARGHKRIVLGTMANEINSGYLFADAYRAALARRGMSAEPDLTIRTENTEDGGYRFADQLLSMRERPTAALVTNEYMAVGIYHRLSEAGLMPGRDLSLIALGQEPSARFLRPKVSCFHTKPNCVSSVFDWGKRFSRRYLRTHKGRMRLSSKKYGLRNSSRATATASFLPRARWRERRVDQRFQDHRPRYASYRGFRRLGAISKRASKYLGFGMASKRSLATNRSWL